MKYTLRDIAAKCKMDVSTVSRALRNDPRVKPETVEKIKNLASGMGYKVNLMARSLIVGRTGAVCFLVNSLDRAIEKEPAAYAAGKLMEYDYDLLIALRQGDERIYKRHLTRLEQGFVDGAVIIPSSRDAKESFVSLQNASVPFVFLDRYLNGIDAPVVSSDNRACLEALIKKVLSEGVSSFIIIGSEINPVAMDRKACSMEILDKLKVPYIYLDESDDFSEVRHEKFKDDVCVLSSDQTLVLQFLKKVRGFVDKKRRVVFAVFDSWIGEPNPADKILICRQDFEKMAFKAVDILMDIIQGRRAMQRELHFFREKEILTKEKEY